MINKNTYNVLKTLRLYSTVVVLIANHSMRGFGILKTTLQNPRIILRIWPVKQPKSNPSSPLSKIEIKESNRSAKQKSSRQKKNSRGKRQMLPAKKKLVTAKEKSSLQKKKSRGKRKMLKAKTKKATAKEESSWEKKNCRGKRK